MQTPKSHSPIAIRLRAHARAMRKQPTVSESVLWKLLKAKQLGVVFRRQQIIGSFIVDFLASKVKVVVEVDGGYHLEPEVAAADAHRDKRLRQAGYRVVRLSAALVVEQPLVAVGKILAALEAEAT